MDIRKTGIIGYGSMGRMLLNKFAESGMFDRDSLFVANRTASKLEEAKYIARISTNTETASSCRIVFICVRPTELRAVLEEICPVISEDTLLVSLNGSITFEQIRKIYKGKAAKVIPSVTAEINRSQTLICFNELADSEDREILRSLLGIIGNVIELPEAEMGMGSELVSCMPGFIASVFDVICQSAKKHTEIPPEDIVDMVLKTMTATGELMLSSGMSFSDVVGRVATKGGITEVGSEVIYDMFPETADELFIKTLEKRRLTAEAAEKSFG